jgi:hypothetical protein
MVSEVSLLGGLPLRSIVLLAAVSFGTATASLAHGIGLNSGGYGTPHYVVNTSQLQCLRAHNNSGVSFAISGWASTPDYYNITAMVESVRNAKDAGFAAVWLAFFLDELHLQPQQQVLQASSATWRSYNGVWKKTAHLGIRPLSARAVALIYKGTVTRTKML